MPGPQTLYDLLWPDSDRSRPLAPVRVGMDRTTGRMVIGERHEDQSVATIFATRIHERVMRRWVGSFVPHLLGESATARVIGRFFWAIFTALDLYEPNVRIMRVRIKARTEQQNVDAAAEQLTSAEEVRAGRVATRMESVRRPRGHLGDFTPDGRRSIGIVGRGRGVWERYPTS